MKILQLIIVIVFASLVQSTYSQHFVDSILHDNVYRHYRGYIPEAYANQTNLPLVFNLHGRGSNAIEQQFYSKMNEVADTSGFIVCYPDGINNVWNSGFDPDSTDDVGFIDVLIDEFLDKYNIDLNRVYSCGMSNGGYHSYYLACEMPNRFAAIASVTGTMFPPVFESCEPGRAMPVLQIHGTNDNTVLYNGSATAQAIEEVIAFWVTNNLCTSKGDTVEIPDIDTTDKSTAQLISYSNCEDDSSVQFYKIFNGAHTWPGAATDFLGVTNYDFSGSEVIWNFFKQHSLESQILNTSSNSLVDVGIGPNPAKNFISIKGLKNATHIKISGINGNLVKQIYDELAHTKIDITDLPAGMYFVNVLAGQKSIIHKIIVSE